MFVDDVIEEGAELRAGQAGCFIGRQLHDMFEGELAGELCSNPVKGPTDRGFVLEPNRVEPQLFFDLLLPRDVASDFRCSDDAPTDVGDRGHGDRCRERSPVLALPGRLEVRHSLAPSHQIENTVLFVLAVRWNDEPDRPSNGFRRLISEHPLGRRIPRRDDAIQVLSDDGIGRRVDDRCESDRRLFRSLSFSDIEHDADGTRVSARRPRDMKSQLQPH